MYTLAQLWTGWQLCSGSVLGMQSCTKAGQGCGEGLLFPLVSTSVVVLVSVLLTGETSEETW